MAQLVLKDVTKRFNKVTAVDRLNLEVERGECFSFLGPSGCGKTTTLRMIAGFEDLDEGELSVDGKLFSSSFRKYYLPPEERDFGMVFQAFAVWPHLSVWDNVAFPLKIRRVPRHEMEERVKKAIKHTGLEKVAKSYPQKLSGGEQQRIALARAIAINPKVMLLDEPLSNLDPKLREEMRFEIKDLQRTFGFTIVFVTHDQSEAMALSDRMLVMDHGVVQQVGTPLDIYHRPANRFVFGFIGLSNFVPVVKAGDETWIAGADGAPSRETGPISGMSPDIAGRDLLLAFRPSEVDFASEGGLVGRVVRRTYLGDVVDYRVAVGGTEIRVQKQRREAVLSEGEACRLKPNRSLWYPRDGE
ncbi:MAG: ABC transporter ATP-binding protein [Spirochaetaceae bacterium]|nr:ABC transporter ATP-binding protein [Spirochaetaceae bacterium]